MSQALTIAARSKLPVPISAGLLTDVTILANRLDPAGLGHEIAHENAPSPALRERMLARRDLLDAHLLPIGKRGAMNEVAVLSTLLTVKRKASDREADTWTELYVKNLEDLPAFALALACADYAQARAGDGKWMPESPELRKLAASKILPVAKERAQINQVLSARVRAPRATPEQRAATVAMAGQVIADMRKADAALRDELRGAPSETVPPFSEVSPKQAKDSLARLADELKDAPAPVLSDECRRITHEGMGIDPNLYDEEQRYRQQIAEQEERAA